jgi:hypothetical protein
MNTIGEEPEERQDLQEEMSLAGLGYLIVHPKGLQLWEFPEEGEPVFTGLFFDSVEAAHAYVFPEIGGFSVRVREVFR